MSETQRYKVANEFTLPTAVVPVLRRLIRARLDIVQRGLQDREAFASLSIVDASDLACECLMLAKMLDTMPKDEADHA
jgi:hypothetical protein